MTDKRGGGVGCGVAGTASENGRHESQRAQPGTETFKVFKEEIRKKGEKDSSEAGTPLPRIKTKGGIIHVLPNGNTNKRQREKEGKKKRSVNSANQQRPAALWKQHKSLGN